MHAGAVAVAHQDICARAFFKHIGKIFTAHDQRCKIALPRDSRGGLGGEFGFRFMIDCGGVALRIGDMRHAAEDSCRMGANIIYSVASERSHFGDQCAHSAA